MPKKKPATGGAADRKRRGLKSVLIPLTPEIHELVQRAAGTCTGPMRAVTRWAAAALEAAARERLAEAGKEFAQGDER